MNRLSAFFALALAGALAGCGSSSSYNVLTAGDSLGDAGTYGFRFTVQGTDTAPNRVWTELVAGALGVALPCPRYQGVYTNPTAVAADPSATHCGGYAVAGAQINVPNFVSSGGDATPQSVLQQIRDIARERTAVLSRELLLINGGGNDAATVFGLWLQWQTEPDPDKAAALLGAYKALMTEMLSPGQVDGADTPEKRNALAPDYMDQLAVTFANALRDGLLTNGARRVVVANVPDITQTPRMKAVLSPLEQLVDRTLYEYARAFARSLVARFNERLAAQFAGESRVAIFDLNATLNAWVIEPPASLLTKVDTPACPQTGTNQGIPTYSIGTCTATALTALADGRSANWWESYLFSDDFHPTPRGHQMAADLIANEVLRPRGWK